MDVELKPQTEHVNLVTFAQALWRYRSESACNVAPKYIIAAITFHLYIPRLAPFRAQPARATAVHAVFARLHKAVKKYLDS